MSTLRALALQFGGADERGSIRVPASQLVAFLNAAREQGVEIHYFECLYLVQGSVEPSMELSRDREDFPSWDGFVQFASSAAETAIIRARTGKRRRARGAADAVFEVGCVEGT